METVSDQDLRIDAAEAAEAAGDAAGVTLRLLDRVEDFALVVELLRSIWTVEDSARAPVNVETLRAVAKAGSYVGGAFDGDELVGTSYGFFGAPGARSFHSHIAGVSSRVQGRSVGFALKAHQRAWALERGIDEIAWTFDPLITRNAYFNFVKLGATPREYLQNFYGRMHDVRNGGDDTDRMLVSWRLADPAVAAAVRGTPVRAEPADAPELVSVGDDGAPVRHDVDADVVAVRIPTDVEALRASDPTLATEWRITVRDTLGALMADGARIVAFDRSGTYTIDRGVIQ